MSISPRNGHEPTKETDMTKETKKAHKGFIDRAEAQATKMLHRLGVAKEAHRVGPSEETEALLEKARRVFQEARGVHTELKRVYALAREAERLVEVATAELREAENKRRDAVALRSLGVSKAWRRCEIVQERYAWLKE